MPGDEALHNADNKNHIITCDECRKFTKEWLRDDRDHMARKVREIIREEWQVTLTTIEDVANLKKKARRLTISDWLQWLFIAYLLFKTIFK